MEHPRIDAAGSPPRVAFTGATGDFFLLQLANLGLAIVTLGIYRFWGKTRVRRFLWRHTLLDGDALEYRGRGLELLVGALLAIVLISVPFALVSIVLPGMLGRGSAGLVIAQGLLLLAIYYVIGVGTYRSWRYLLSRTAWRGIRGGMTGQGWSFGLYNFGLILVQGFSLGFATPWVGVRRWNRLARDMRIGSFALEAHARSRPIYLRFLAVWAVMFVLFAALIAWMVVLFTSIGIRPETPPTPVQILTIVAGVYGGMFVLGFLGALAFAQYHAAFLRQTYGATFVGGTMRLRFDVTARAVVIYYLVNIALVVFTLGIGLLLIPYRRWEFHAARLAIEGSFDADAMRQTDLAAPGQGDGIADAFDLAPF